MLPNLEPFVGADSRLNRGFGLHWNLERKFAQYLMESVTKKSPQLANTGVEGCETTAASKAGLDFWQRVKEGSCRSGRSSMVWVCWRVGWRRLILQGIFSLNGDKRCCGRREVGVESETSFFMETLSDEVGFGQTGESSTVDITGSLTESARAVNFERRWVRGQLGPKDSRSELREKERPNRKWSTSQREGRWDTCKRRPKRRILQHMVNLEEMFPRETQAASNTRQRPKWEHAFLFSWTSITNKKQ